MFYKTSENTHICLLARNILPLLVLFTYSTIETNKLQQIAQKCENLEVIPKCLNKKHANNNRKSCNS